MTDLMPFAYEGEPVRAFVIDGDAEFVAADVCRILGHTNPSSAVAGLDDDERGLRIVETPSGAQQMVTVTEPGLYTLIIRSRKPEAKNFRRWVTHEVLPTIRKTEGAYITPGSQAELDLTNPDTALDKLIEIAQVAKAERARANREQAARELAETRVAALAPKAEAFDSFLNGEGCYLIGTVARMLGVGQNIMFKFLYEQRVLIKYGPRRKQPYANPKFDGWFRVRTHDEERTNGHASLTTMVTPRGAEAIRLLAIEKGLIEPALIVLPYPKEITA